VEKKGGGGLKGGGGGWPPSITIGRKEKRGKGKRGRRKGESRPFSNHFPPRGERGEKREAYGVLLYSKGGGGKGGEHVEKKKGK